MQRSAPLTPGPNLGTEAGCLHRALFDREAPEEVQEQYASALKSAPLAEIPRCDLGRLIARGADLEAIELALRRTGINGLTQRFQVLCYLVEARPEYYAHFVNEQPRLLLGWLALAAHGVRSLYKLLKGRWLLRVHAIR